MVHPRLVRVAHSINVIAFGALVVSGVAIVLAHPRFYWGETGYFDVPAAFELPLPVIKQHTGWGRSLHFLAAWIAIANGIVYLVWGILSRHFAGSLLPERGQMRWRAVSEALREHLRTPASSSYNVIQKVTYLGVVFVLPPVIVLSGVTMSPAITAAFPWLFTLFGGRQSARMIHFFAASAGVIFLFIHVAMIALTGWRQQLRAILTEVET